MNGGIGQGKLRFSGNHSLFQAFTSEAWRDTKRCDGSEEVEKQHPRGFESRSSLTNATQTSFVFARPLVHYRAVNYFASFC